MQGLGHVRAAVVITALVASGGTLAHGTSNLEARFDVIPSGAAAGQTVTLEVVLTELADGAAAGAVVKAAVITDDDEQRFEVAAAEGLRFRGSFQLKDGSHDLRVYVIRGEVREVAIAGFQVDRTLQAIPEADRVLFLNPAGKYDAIPTLDHLAGVLGGAAALIAIIVLLRRPRRAADATAAKPPWMLLVAAAAAVATPFGGYWDVAFHMANAREGLLSPPHLLIYGGILGSMLVIGVALLLSKPSELSYPGYWRQNPVAFAAGVALAFQLSSAPFDELWHGLFGLDVSVWSPPHAVLIFGGVAVFLTLASLPVRSHGLSIVFVRIIALGAALLAIDLFLAESVFPFPDWHVSQQRPALVFVLLEVLGATLVAVVARRVVELRLAATASMVAFLGLRCAVYPLLALLDVATVPRFPMWLPALVLIGILVDVTGRRRQS